MLVSSMASVVYGYGTNKENKKYRIKCDTGAGTVENGRRNEAGLSRVKRRSVHQVREGPATISFLSFTMT